MRGLPPEELGAFVPKIRAVTADQIRRAGKTYFPSKSQTVIVVGDVEKVKADVEQFGAAQEQKQ